MRLKSNALPANVCHALGALVSRDETQVAGGFGSVPKGTGKCLNQTNSRECGGVVGAIRVEERQVLTHQT